MGFIKRYLFLFKKFYFSLLRDGFKRADYLRKKKCLGEIGENVYFYSRIFPAEPEQVRLKSNIVVATNVRFMTHDRMDLIIKWKYGKDVKKYIGSINVGNNVFIGCDTVILPGVTIGDNCIIGAGSVVTKDLESGGIYAGAPAKKVGNFEDFIEKRMKYYKKEKKKK